MSEPNPTVRPATPGEYPVVRSILEVALLEVPGGACRRRPTLVAIEDGRILGALILDGNEIVAVAVRPNRRGGGIGSALVDAAARRRPRLVACFDRRVRPFYESLGFEIEPLDPGSHDGREPRFRGILDRR